MLNWVPLHDSFLRKIILFNIIDFFIGKVISGRDPREEKFKRKSKRKEERRKNEEIEEDTRGVHLGPESQGGTPHVGSTLLQAQAIILETQVRNLKIKFEVKSPRLEGT